MKFLKKLRKKLENLYMGTLGLACLHVAKVILLNPYFLFAVMAATVVLLSLALIGPDVPVA